MDEKIIALVKEKGLLVEKDIIDLLGSFPDISRARVFLENLERVSGQKMITSRTLTKNFEIVKNVVDNLPGEAKKSAEKIIIRMGLSLEITKEKEIIPVKEETKSRYQIFYADAGKGKKIEVSDFVTHFRDRYSRLQKILMQRPGMENLTSINKISRNRQSITIIGIVQEKRVTKNKNLMITFEDLTGRIGCLVRGESECFSKANELQMDDVVAVRASGNNEMLFVHDIIYPDSFLPDKERFKEDFCIAFVSDVHAGSKKHKGKEFKKFVAWLNGDDELAKKIKYIFFVGDNVDGVGIFPGQERLLEITSLEKQYELLASYLKAIPKNITMFMCPGQHDSVRVAEPQPIITKHYASSLYEIENLILVSNPSYVKLIEEERDFNVLMYHGASMHVFINEIEELRLMKAQRTPAKAVKHMLKRRHLAPMYGVSTSVVYVPNSEYDPLVITDVPDVLCTGEMHRLDIDKYNGTLIINGSCWQSPTEFEEKVGNIPDPCKVPVLNLKTREIKILDFTEVEDGKGS